MSFLSLCLEQIKVFLIFGIRIWRTWWHVKWGKPENQVMEKKMFSSYLCVRNSVYLHCINEVVIPLSYVSTCLGEWEGDQAYITPPLLFVFVLLTVLYVESCKSIHLLSDIPQWNVGQRATSMIQSGVTLAEKERAGRGTRAPGHAWPLEMTGVPSMQATLVPPNYGGSQGGVSKHIHNRYTLSSTFKEKKKLK